MELLNRLVRALGGGTRQPRRHVPLPSACGIKITDRCNLRCRHCNLYEHRSTEMSFDEVRRLIDALRRHGFLDLVFSGGEPFLRRDLLDLIDYAIAQGLNVRVCTNCSLLNQDTVRRLLAMDVHFSLSLDGSTPEIHAAVRGKAGNFEQVIKTMRWLEEVGAPIGVNTVLMRENMENQRDLAGFLAQFRGVEWSHNPANVMQFESRCLAPGAKVTQGKPVWSDYDDPEVVQCLCGAVDELASLQRNGQTMIKTTTEQWRGIKAYIRGRAGDLYHCDLAGASSMPVNANGDVSLCGTWISADYVVGNVVKQDYDLEKIWNSDRAWDARERSLRCANVCWVHGRCKQEKRIRLQDRFPAALEKMSITRWKLLNWMMAEVDRAEPQGRVLEIGSTMSMKYLFLDVQEFITSDCFYSESWHPAGQPIERKEDVTRLSFADSSFDCLLCHQVLEHVVDLEAAAREMHRVLKPGGVLWFSSPFVDHYHPTPRDYWRISRDGYFHLLRAFSRVELEEFGNLRMYPLVLAKEERSDWDLQEFGPTDTENPLQILGWAVK